MLEGSEKTIFARIFDVIVKLQWGRNETKILGKTEVFCITSLTEFKHKMRSGDLPAYLSLNGRWLRGSKKKKKEIR